MPTDRSRAPELRPIREVVLPEYIYEPSDTGPDLLVVNGGVKEVFKLEVVFDAGRYHESKKLVSAITQRMLREGTKKYSSEDIAEKIDYYGATLSVPSNLDDSCITMYGLNRYFNELLPIIRSVITEPAFPEKELITCIKERKERQQLDLSKNDIVAYRQVTEYIFGPDHPYGYNSKEDLFSNISISDLKKHFNNHYKSGNCTIILSGKISDEMIRSLKNELSSAIPSGKTNPLVHEMFPRENKFEFIERPNSLQTAIRIGCRLFDRNHPDFPGLYFLNVILGEYFSSRLMMNIREDKGYTYSIYSMLDIMRRDGLFLVSTEVANEYVEDTVKEIKVEFEKLKTEFISDREINMARNYTLGTLLSALDGPFNSSDVVKGLILNKSNENFFSGLVNVIKTVDARELQRLAIEYLNYDNMYTVMVGKR